jgi:ribosomal-protein-alanine N-acetyltransferase
VRLDRVPQIRTARLTLRGFTRDDLPRWNASLFADPEVIRYLPVDGALGDDALAGAYERGRAHWEAHGYGLWAVCDGSTGALMGHCGLRLLDAVGETELYYALGRAHWGLGYTTEAARPAMDFGFDVAGLTRIVAYAVPENRASTNVMRKLGMVFEAEVDIFGLHCARYAIDRGTWDRSAATGTRRCVRG